MGTLASDYELNETLQQINVLMTNEMHNSYNQFLFHSFYLLYLFRRIQSFIVRSTA